MRFMEKVPVRVASMVQNSYEFFFIEIKPLFSVILTHLGANGTTLPHSHPFDAITILLKGAIQECGMEDQCEEYYAPAFKRTSRQMHEVGTGKDGAWFLTFRGPWSDTWQEQQPDGSIKTLTHGRREV